MIRTIKIFIRDMIKHNVTGATVELEMSVTQQYLKLAALVCALI